MCAVYIPPNSSYELYLQVFHYLESIISQPRTIIVSDFNLPDINWSNLSGHSPQSTGLCDFVFCHNLEQMVDFPTHSQSNTLDLMFTNFHGPIEHPTCFSSYSLKSDHLFLSFFTSTPLKLAKSKCSPTFAPNFK